jgi:predicted metal-binding membrane protein
VAAATSASRGAREARHQRAFVPLLAGLVALAWLALWALGHSPWGALLGHESWSSEAAFLCRALPGATVWLPAAFATAGWVLMTVAMMLPTTLPLFDAFDRVAQARTDHALLLAMLGLGYLSAWTAFGLAAHVLHEGVRRAVDAVPALALRPWLIGAALLALAGAFQFSDLKHRCLEKCRAPFGFVVQHWRGGGPRRQAFALGAHHGLYCVGCCWALMLLMFALGAGSLGWMLALAAAMAIEKNAPWGQRLGAPLGFTLLAGAAVVLVLHA